MKRVIIFFVISALIWPLFSIGATTQEEIDARNKQIEEIQRQIDAYQQQIDENSAKARTLSVEISRLNAQVNKIQLEIKSLGIAIDQTNFEIQDTQKGIQIATDELGLHKEVLAKYMRILYELDKENLTRVLLSNAKLSDFFNNLKNLGDIQDNLQTTIVSIKDLRADLEQKESNLQDKKSELGQLKSLQESERADLSQAKKQKDTILKETKGQEAKFQQLVKQSQQDIARIREQVSYLIQNGVTVEEAIKFGQLAAIRAGIRPAFLIAVLEVESKIGVNVGRCNRAGDPPEKSWRVIMHSRDFEPFAAITSALGLDMGTTPVSCPQYVNGRQYGWGGAMGPAQFIPSTWVGYADKVAQLVGRPTASPWNIEDAFMAAAVKLANAGATAKTRTAEIAASKAYYSGKSTCKTAQCNSYANTIQNKAAIIEQSL